MNPRTNLEVTKREVYLTLKLLKPIDSIKELVGDVTLINNDLQLYVSDVDNGVYIYDTVADHVAELKASGVDFLSYLLWGREITLLMNPNSNIYNDYEWNRNF